MAAEINPRPYHPDPRDGRFYRYWLDSMTAAEYRALLRFYRTLRCAYWDKQAGEMRAHGMTRDQARSFLMEFAIEVDWFAYLGSK